jgi:hypothetical protein
VWPYFVYSDHRASVEKEQKIAYWQTVDSLPRSDFNYDEFAGRVEERTSTSGERAGDDMIATVLADRLLGLKSNLSAFERIVPPTCYITLHADQVRVLHNYIPILDEYIASFKSHDKAAIAAARQKEEAHRLEVAQVTKRILDEWADLGLAPPSAGK